MGRSSVDLNPSSSLNCNGSPPLANTANGGSGSSSRSPAPIYNPLTSMWNSAFNPSAVAAAAAPTSASTSSCSSSSVSTKPSLTSSYLGQQLPPHSSYGYPPTPPIEMKFESSNNSSNPSSGAALDSYGGGHHHHSHHLHHSLSSNNPESSSLNGGTGSSSSTSLPPPSAPLPSMEMSRHHMSHSGGSSSGLHQDGSSPDHVMSSLAGFSSSYSVMAGGRKLQEGTAAPEDMGGNSSAVNSGGGDPAAGGVSNNDSSALAGHSGFNNSGINPPPTPSTAYPYFASPSSDLSSPLYGSYSTTGVFSSKAFSNQSKPRNKSSRANAGKLKRPTPTGLSPPWRPPAPH